MDNYGNLDDIIIWNAHISIHIMYIVLCITYKYINMCVCVSVLQEWTDEFINWAPSEFNGIEMVRVKPTDIWFPDFTVYTGFV